MTNSSMVSSVLVLCRFTRGRCPQFWRWGCRYKQRISEVRAEREGGDKRKMYSSVVGFW